MTRYVNYSCFIAPWDGEKAGECQVVLDGTEFYGFDRDSKRLALQQAINNRQITLPGSYIVTTTAAATVAAHLFEVEKVTQPELRIK